MNKRYEELLSKENIQVAKLYEIMLNLLISKEKHKYFETPQNTTKMV